MTRLRLVQLVVQVVVVADDGDTLTPVQVQPVTVNAVDLDTFPEFLRSEIAAQEAGINGPQL